MKMLKRCTFTILLAVMLLALGGLTSIKAFDSTTQAKTYTVKRGDNLCKISKKYHVAVSNLISWSKIKNPSLIRVGQKLVLSKSSTSNKTIPKPTLISVPILMYHSIAYEKGNDLRIPKDKFSAEMKYLKSKGYTFLSLDELYSILNNKSKAPKKPIVITFDDGYEDNYVSAFPVIKELGIKATVFEIVSAIDRSKTYITSDQIKEMSNTGFDVESHDWCHVELSKQSYDTQYQTLLQAKKTLESIKGKSVKYIAYPFGQFNSYTEKAAKNAGYVMAVTTKSGNADISQGVFFLHRVRMSNNQSLSGFEKQFK